MHLLIWGFHVSEFCFYTKGKWYGKVQRLNLIHQRIQLYARYVKKLKSSQLAFNKFVSDSHIHMLSLLQQRSAYLLQQTRSCD